MSRPDVTPTLSSILERCSSTMRTLMSSGFGNRLVPQALRQQVEQGACAFTPQQLRRLPGRRLDLIGGPRAASSRAGSSQNAMRECGQLLAKFAQPVHIHVDDIRALALDAPA